MRVRVCVCVCVAYASALRNPQNLLLPDIFAGQFRDLPPWRLRVYLRRVARQHLATSHLTTRTIRSCVNFTRFTQPRNVHGLCPSSIGDGDGREGGFGVVFDRKKLWPQPHETPPPSSE